MNAGDTIAHLSEIKPEYFDPELVNRTAESRSAKEQSAEGYLAKAAALANQASNARKERALKIEQTQNKLSQSKLKVQTLEADLVQASRDFIGSERGVSIQGNKIIASSIFKWYKKDFGGNEAGILAHLRQYATGSKKAALDAASDINKYDYDWDLNIR